MDPKDDEEDCDFIESTDTMTIDSNAANIGEGMTNNSRFRSLKNRDDHRDQFCPTPCVE
jgi:hypothetical protein